jgi:hypothetical protein
MRTKFISAIVVDFVVREIDVWTKKFVDGKTVLTFKTYPISSARVDRLVELSTYSIKYSVIATASGWEISYRP